MTYADAHGRWEVGRWVVGGGVINVINMYSLYFFLFIINGTNGYGTEMLQKKGKRMDLKSTYQRSH